MREDVVWGSGVVLLFNKSWLTKSFFLSCQALISRPDGVTGKNQALILRPDGVTDGATGKNQAVIFRAKPAE